jgi:hemimethylated DNA binding protein
MPDKSQLPYLLKLLGDDSEEIRDTVLTEFASFGPTLEETLKKQFELDVNQRKLLQPILKNHRKDWLKRTWPSWFELDNAYRKIEIACSIIAQYQYGLCYPVSLHSLLDQLADEFTDKRLNKDAFQLARFLFTEKKLTGADTDYYHPRNSNLIYVILEKQGIPISLASVLILTGNRVGITIEGCNFPGHFLARAWLEDKMVLIDCYHGGQIIKSDQLLENPSPSVRDGDSVLHGEFSAEAMIERMLRNLVRAYQHKNEAAEGYLMIDLLNTMANYTIEQSRADGQPSPKTPKKTKVLYKPGQLVRHKKYGYRGVIVDCDSTCQADALWYESNQSQPNPDQPWYHTLVHEANHSTYVAQSNLLPDRSAQPIVHPLVTVFYSEFKNGYYIRNYEPWPGG